MTPGLATAMVAMGLLFGGLLLERALLAVRWRPYFAVSLPLKLGLAPFPHAPQRAGASTSVSWSGPKDQEVLWWGTARETPMGLHGMARWVEGPSGASLTVHWAPPWTLWGAAAWLIGLGLVRGEGWLTVPIGSLMWLGTTVVYWRSARLVAEELRSAFSRVPS